MKKIGLLFVALIFAYFGYQLLEEPQPVQGGLFFEKGDSMENFTLTNMKGETVELDSVIANNKFVWVNFWATWCGVCREQKPRLIELYNQYQDEGFTIVAISIGETNDTVQSYLSENPVPFPVWLDPEKKVASRFKINFTPTSFLVDSTGIVRREGTGIQPGWEDFLSQQLKKESVTKATVQAKK